MARGTVYIVGAGEFTPKGFHPQKADLVLAADGGYEALRRHRVRPGLVLGDMDSIPRLPEGIGRLRFPVMKDDTDLALGIRLALGRGYSRFKLYGALGGRLDHSLANLQLLAGLAKQGCRGAIIASGLVVRAVSGGTLRLPPMKKGLRVSVFAWGEPARGVSLQGLKYPLMDASLDAFTPLGVSNEANGQAAEISVKSGVLLVFLQTGA